MGASNLVVPVKYNYNDQAENWYGKGMQHEWREQECI
jgi:hypothetical protein